MSQAVGMEAHHLAWSVVHALVRKVKKLNSLRPILFKLSQKKYRRGAMCPPPLVGIMLRQKTTLSYKAIFKSFMQEDLLIWCMLIWCMLIWCKLKNYWSFFASIFFTIFSAVPSSIPSLDLRRSESPPLYLIL